MRAALEGPWGRFPLIESGKHRLVRDLDYLARLHREPPALVLELEELGHKDGIPIVDRATGRLLSTLVHCMQANRILEIGTAYGYSTLWMALAMPPAGHLWTIDPDRRRTEIAARYFERAGVAEKIDIMNQPAAEVLENFDHRNLDIIFLDANKEQYPIYLELGVPMLKRSGLMIVDNLLWSGRAAANPGPKDDESTSAIRRFNELFLRHPLLDATIVPVGDGVGIGARVG
jgi:predicted O-methyltransferase YrrM